MQKIKKIIINLCLLLVSLIISLIILESVLTIFFNAPNYIDYSRNPPRMKANITASFYVDGKSVEIKSNSEGLRTNEYDKKSINPNRILLIGDSFTLGMVDFNNTYGNLLEQRLKEDYNNPEVISAGFPGFGTVNERKIMEQLLLVYNPKKVILFFVNNDVDDVLDELNTSLIERKKMFEKTRNLFYFIRDYFFSKSVFIRARVHNVKCVLRKIGLANELTFYYTVYDKNEGGWGWNVTIEQLRLIKKELDKKNIEFYVVLIPQRYLINPEEWKWYKNNNCISGEGINFNNPGRILEKFFKEENISFLDMKDYLIGEGKVYYTYDGHLNPRGNNITSNAIYKTFFINK